MERRQFKRFPTDLTGAMIIEGKSFVGYLENISEKQNSNESFEIQKSFKKLKKDASYSTNISESTTHIIKEIAKAKKKLFI